MDEVPYFSDRLSASFLGDTHMKNDTRTHQIEAMRQRVRVLYRSADVAPMRHDLLPEAFEELHAALEELQTMQDELRQQKEYLLETCETVESERQTYRELFELAPIGYLVTGLDGTIHKANQATATLLNSTEKMLVGRSLALFVPEGERRSFRSQIVDLRQADRPVELLCRLQPWNGAPFEAELMASVARGGMGRAVGLRWVVRATGRLRARVAELERRLADLEGHALVPLDGKDVPSVDPGRRAEVSQRRLAALVDASLQLAVSFDDSAALERAVGMLVPPLADLCILDMIERDGGIRRLTIGHVSALGKPPEHKQLRRYQPDPARHGGAPVAIYTDAPRLSAPISDDLLRAIGGDAEHQRLLRVLAPVSCICAPLQSRERVVGALTLLTAGADGPYSPEDLTLVREFAGRAAVAVERVQLHR